MPVAIGIWSISIEPGQSTQFVAECDIRVTTASLGEDIKDETSRSTIKLTYLKPQNDDSDDSDEEEKKEDEEQPIATTVLCSLTPGKIEQTTLDLILEEDDEYEFENTGKNVVYITGNYVDQRAVPFNDGVESDFDGDEDEDAYDLRDVSSDVEIDPAELEVPSDSEMEDASNRFEEIKDEDEVPASKKRERDSDAAQADEEKGSKKKKKNKKQKAEDGKAVPTGDDKPESKAKPESKSESKPKSDTDKKAAADSKTKKIEQLELPGGLKIGDVKVGTGPSAKAGDKVKMRYIGKHLDGKVFDSNTKGKPFIFTLGEGEVIKGWDQGIVGMKVGGERLLTVPPALGYGKRKVDGIPPGSTLRFECKLIAIN